MGGLLAELGKKLAEKWLSLLVLPGLLYLGVLAGAHTLGDADPFAVSRITRQIDAWASTHKNANAGVLALVLLAVLLSSAGAGLAAVALGSFIERFWFADRWQTWPWPLRWVAGYGVRRRNERWNEASRSYQKELDEQRKARAHGSSTLVPAKLTDARQAMIRIALEQPARPTWIGDRVQAVAIRLDREYLLDLPTVWPCLWLQMVDTDRTEVTAARDAFSRAATLCGWGLLYAVVGAVWWPGLLLAATLVMIAWRRGRAAADVYALLVEAAAHLRVPDLARSLGIDHTGPLTRQTGWALSCLLQGRSHLVALTTGWPTSLPKQSS